MDIILKMKMGGRGIGHSFEEQEDERCSQSNEKPCTVNKDHFSSGVEQSMWKTTRQGQVKRTGRSVRF